MQTYLEVACDESGFSGTNLLDPDDPVITHASVSLTAEQAGELVATVLPHRTGESKSSRLGRSALTMLLDPAGPLAGSAHVHLTDKTLYTVRMLLALFVREPGYAVATSLDRDHWAQQTAQRLRALGSTTYGKEQWRASLQSFVTLMRDKRNWTKEAYVEDFFRTVAGLQPRDEVVSEILRGRSRIGTLRTRLKHDPGMPPPLEPLLPAVLETARYWSTLSTAGPVVLVHDEQSALTRGRIQQIQYLLGGGLHAVRQADSRVDPRIQVADFLAGTARRIAAADLAGSGDAELSALLSPFVDTHSIWPLDQRRAMPL